MDVTVTRKFRERNGSSKVNNYNFSSAVTPGAGAIYAPIPPAIIPFTLTSAPSVLNYQSKYSALYGAWPRVSLFTYDENDDLIERMEKPRRVIVEDKLDSIVWYLGEGMEDTGVIILYPTT